MSRRLLPNGRLGARRFLQSLSSIGAFGVKAADPPQLPAIDAEELDRRIRFAIREALAERGSPPEE